MRSLKTNTQGIKMADLKTSTVKCLGVQQTNDREIVSFIYSELSTTKLFIFVFVFVSFLL